MSKPKPMPAPISVILPTLNADTVLGPTLACLIEGLEAGLIAEVICADGGSTDATRAIADRWGAGCVVCPPSRGGQLRAGAGAARAAWYLFLHADTHLPQGWTRPIAAHIHEQSQGRAACFYLSFRSKHLAARWVAGWANLRTRWFHLPYGDQGLLIHASLYNAVGGYPDQPLMEDVEIARRLRGRITVLPATVTTGDEKFQRDGWLRRGAKNLSLLLRYKLGANAADLARRYG